MNTVYALLIVFAPQGGMAFQKFENIDTCKSVKSHLAASQFENRMSRPMSETLCLEIRDNKKE